MQIPQHRHIALNVCKQIIILLCSPKWSIQSALKFDDTSNHHRFVNTGFSDNMVKHACYTIQFRVCAISILYQYK